METVSIKPSQHINLFASEKRAKSSADGGGSSGSSGAWGDPTGIPQMPNDGEACHILNDSHLLLMAER